MKTRCNNPNQKQYKNYGGRGITYCERWESFYNFLNDMGERPPNTSLDRIDNDGNYEKGNCRWSPTHVQMRNRSDNVMISYEGKTMCLVDWASLLGVRRQLIKSRLDSGWCVSDALTIQPGGTRTARPGVVEYNGRIYTRASLAKEYGLPPPTLSYRLRSGWSIEDALNTPVGYQRKGT
jgi:hypothetical protein